MPVVKVKPSSLLRAGRTHAVRKNEEKKIAPKDKEQEKGKKDLYYYGYSKNI